MSAVNIGLTMDLRLPNQGFIESIGMTKPVYTTIAKTMIPANAMACEMVLVRAASVRKMAAIANMEV